MMTPQQRAARTRSMNRANLRLYEEISKPAHQKVEKILNRFLLTSRDLMSLWNKIKSLLMREEPQPEPELPRPPRGVEMAPGLEDQEFVLRLSDGNYYAGPGQAQGAIERTARLEDAARFPNRWAALQAASIGPVFANAAIMPVRVRQWPASIAGRR